MCMLCTITKQRRPRKLKRSLNTIVPHAFGNHENCSESWCGYLKEPDTYKHNELPGGFDLSDAKLRNDLQQIFTKFADKSDKLLNCGSSQAKESLNQIITTKVPKNKHFGGSESVNFRVAAGISQKNDGRQYVSDVNQLNGLSPGKVTIVKNEILDKKRKRKRDQQILPETKKGRKKKKTENQVTQLCAETKEGATYSSDIGMGPAGDNVDISTIPDPVQSQKYSKIDTNDDLTIVIFDLETTGFGHKTEIVQLAATKEGGAFDKYILPKNPLNPKAAEVTQLYSTGSRLYYRGEHVATESVQSVINNFIDWLPENALLVAHNCKNFDANVLTNHVLITNLTEKFKSKVCGFADTLTLFKAMLPKRKSYSQSALASDILEDTYDAHNAREDVLVLKRLVDSSEVTCNALLQHSFHTEDVIKYLQQSDIRKNNLTTFYGVIREKVLTKHMSNKAAASGLTLKHFKSACERHGYDGIYAICSEKNDEGNPRVTNRKAVVQRLYKYLSK